MRRLIGINRHGSQARWRSTTIARSNGNFESSNSNRYNAPTMPASIAPAAEIPTTKPHRVATSDTPIALSVTQLTRRHGETKAVDGLTFEIHEGEVFGLLGPNGAGKTTTISVLSTLLKPHGGEARIFGASIREDVAGVRAKIGLVPQNISLYPSLTAAENIRFFGRMYGVKPPLLDQRVDELLELVGLDKRRDDRVGVYSGGMKRRLNLAVSLVHQPRLLLLDEPTVGVDPHSREHIFDIIRNLKRGGTAILYTTHYMEEAENLCDRLAIMDEGQIAATGTLNELLATRGCAETILLRGAHPSQVKSRFATHPDVREIDSEGDTCRLLVSRASGLLGPLQDLTKNNPNVSIQITPMSLGDLFLHLTGKELRD